MCHRYHASSVKAVRRNEDGLSLHLAAREVVEGNYERSSPMAHPARAAKTFGHPVPINLMPSTFGADYVENVVAPYILSNRYTGDQPVLPMLDLIFGKAGSTMAHIWGLLYDGWQDAGEEEGLTVFLQDYENRGPNNERKKIYYSAVTPDLYDPMYAPKIRRFVDRLFVEENAGQPLMHKYYEQYFDMYWDLHVGVTGDQIPAEMREMRTRSGRMNGEMGDLR